MRLTAASAPLGIETPIKCGSTHGAFMVLIAIVQFVVVGFSEHHKIVERVVILYAVNVMHMLQRSQLPTQVLLHHVAVLLDNVSVIVKALLVGVLSPAHPSAKHGYLQRIQRFHHCGLTATDDGGNLMRGELTVLLRQPLAVLQHFWHGGPPRLSRLNAVPLQGGGNAGRRAVKQITNLPHGTGCVGSLQPHSIVQFFNPLRNTFSFEYGAPIIAQRNL